MKRMLTGTAILFTALVPSLAMARSAGDDQGVHVLIVLLFAMPVLYFVPSFIAASKEHPQPGRVFFVNLFLGWTIIGWFVSLFWAIEKGGPKEPAPLPVPLPVFTPELAAKEIEDLIAQRDCAAITEADYLLKKQQILERWATATSPAKPRRFHPASA